MKLPKNEYRISITSACNMKCVYCHNEGNREVNRLDKDEIELLISHSDQLGLQQVRLTGGEPLIHPQIEEICEMLSEKYHLKVGINTNALEIETLLLMIQRGWIHRVVVGIDYFEAPISKQSPIGICSQEILARVMQIKALGCQVSISVVYQGDMENITKLTAWAIEHGVRIKILEKVDENVASEAENSYIQMRTAIMQLFSLTEYIDPLFHEMSGMIGDTTAVTFFHSHCRVRECDLCKKMHLRVTSTGKLKQCLLDDKGDIAFKRGDVRKNIITAIQMPVQYHMGK